MPKYSRKLLKNADIGLLSREHADERGRPKIELDLQTLEKLCMLHVTIDEIAAFFEVSEEYIRRRMVADARFRAAIARGEKKGKVSLKRAQYNEAMKGNAAMLKWLGVNWLEQRDSVKVSGVIDVDATTGIAAASGPPGNADEQRLRKQSELFAQAALKKAQAYSIDLPEDVTRPIEVDLVRNEDEEGQEIDGEPSWQVKIQ